MGAECLLFDSTVYVVSALGKDDHDQVRQVTCLLLTFHASVTQLLHPKPRQYRANAEDNLIIHRQLFLVRSHI